MAITLAQIIGVSLALWGGYRIVNRWILLAREAEKHEIRKPNTGARHDEE